MEKLLEASEALNGEFNHVFDYGPVDNAPRVKASWTMCSVSLEHSVSLRQLMVMGNYTSAICIMRSQFEAVTRAMWLFYAASESKIATVTGTLSELSQNADQKPSNVEMIKALESKAPDMGVLMLKDFREHQWKGLNSFVHGGVHAMQRHGVGYPGELLEGIIKSSNGLLTIATMMAAILTANETIVKDIVKIQQRHIDCLPVLLAE